MLLRNESEQFVGERTHDTVRARPPLTTFTAADSVQIFRRGNTLSIVVRDPLLGERDALRYAFEAAQVLIGSDARLQQVTLNARVLYRHRDESTLHHTAALLFTC